LGALAVV